MAGNSTSLYSTSTSNGSVSSNNLTTLYPTTGGAIVPTTPYGNANVVALLNEGSDGGNTVGNISAVGNVTANYFIGNGSQLTDIVAVSSNTAVTVTGNAQPNITSVGTLTSLSSSGNITGNYFLGNGSQLTGLPATYSNANVTSLLANFGSNVISTTGNITGGNLITTGVVSATGNIYTQGYFVGNFQGNISGNIVVPGSNTQVIYNNNGNAGASAGFTFNSASNVVTVANTVTANNVSTPTVYGQGLALQGYDFVQMQYSNSVTLPVDHYDIGTGSWFYLDAGGATFQSNTTGTFQQVIIGNDSSISATGNITGNYFIGNGSQLTGLPATYSNANVATFLANFGSNVVSTTGTVTAGNVTGDNIFTGGVVSATGNVRGNNINTAGLVTATGNVYGSYFIGNGSQLTGLPAGYSNADVATFLANFGSNSISTTGNVTAGYLIGNGSALTSITGANVVGAVANATYAVSAGSATTAGTVTTNAQPNITSVGTLTSVSVSGNATTGNLLTGGIVSATGNITGNYFLGNGSLLTGIASTYGNANVAAFLPTYTGDLNPGNVAATGNVSGNILKTTGTSGNIQGANYISGNSFVGTTVSMTGNITGGNVLTPGIISATGNVSGAYFLGNGSQLTGLVSNAAGSNTQIQYNNANAFAGNAAMTFDNTTGNVTLANIIIGSGNVGRSGGAQRINTSNAWTGTSVNTTLQPGQIVIGNGYFGNLDPTNSQTAGVRGAKVVIWDSANISESGGALTRLAGLTVNSQQVLAGNIANTTTQVRGGIGSMIIGGGASNYTFSAPTNFGQIVGWNQFLGIGQPNTTIALGNITINTQAVASFAQMIMYAGSNLLNSVGTFSQINNSGNITNQIGTAVQFTQSTAPTVTPSTVIGYYMPGSSSTYGFASSNGQRAASNYYFLKNDDSVAQNQLGSLRAYHTYQYSTGTSGTVDINKNNGQIQWILPTGNVTIGSYLNFVTAASNSVVSQNQSDTVTLIIEQGGTGYDIFMPGANAIIKYANGVSTISNVAGTITTVTIQAYRNSGNTATYLTTISPVFS